MSINLPNDERAAAPQDDEVCENCGSNDLTYTSSPGMAGWASPIFTRTCETCGQTDSEEFVDWTRSYDIG